MTSGKAEVCHYSHMFTGALLVTSYIKRGSASFVQCCGFGFFLFVFNLHKRSPVAELEIYIK